MSVIHSAYLFNYKKFKEDAELLVRFADSGNGKPLLERAISIVDGLQKQHHEWIIADEFGNPLVDVSKWTMPLTPEKTGYCFLLVLSDYLQSPLTYTLGIMSDWPFLHAGLVAIGWSERDAILLTKGSYTEVLLRPEEVDDPLQRPNLSGNPLSHDFAWWVRPGYGSAGWLDIETLHKLHERLIQSRDQLLQLTSLQLRRNIYPTTGQSPSTDRLMAAYNRTLEMLTTAKQYECGLFMMII